MKRLLKKRRIILFGTIVILLLVLTIMLYSTCFKQDELLKSYLIVDAVIVDIFISIDSSSVILTVKQSDILKRIILQDNTKLCYHTGSLISVTDLVVGQQVVAYVDNLVIYDQPETFVECYKIVVQ